MHRVDPFAVLPTWTAPRLIDDSRIDSRRDSVHSHAAERACWPQTSVTRRDLCSGWLPEEVFSSGRRHQTCPGQAVDAVLLRTGYGFARHKSSSTPLASSLWAFGCSTSATSEACEVTAAVFGQSDFLLALTPVRFGRHVRPDGQPDRQVLTRRA